MTYMTRLPGVPRSAILSAACLGLLVLQLAAPTLAATVYKTVGANGVVTYSDTPPAEAVEVETLEIDARAPELSDSAHEQLEAMRETTDRMVADRQQREKHRAEMRKLQIESESRSQVIDYSAPAGNNGIYSGYYPYPVYRPRGGGYRPRPGHPSVRPPLRPGPPVPELRPISPGYDYPASLIRRGYSPQVRAAFE
jgi:hypothetical protein